MSVQGFKDFIKTNPKFDKHTHGEISASNMTVTYLYNQYINWLITQQIQKPISTLDLLAQIHIINQFILNKTCDRVNETHTVVPMEGTTVKSYIQDFNQSDAINDILISYVKTRDKLSKRQKSLLALDVTQIGACSQLCLVVGAALIGACLAADLSVAVIYSLGALGGVFIGASLIFLRKAMNYHDDLLNLSYDNKKTLDDAVSGIAHEITSELRKPLLMSAIKATLLGTSNTLMQTDTPEKSRYAVNLESVRAKLPA